MSIAVKLCHVWDICFIV